MSKMINTGLVKYINGLNKDNKNIDRLFYRCEIEKEK